MKNVWLFILLLGAFAMELTLMEENSKACTPHQMEKFNLEYVKPSFLLLGAPKGGTTSFADYVQHHPKVMKTKLKEPHFFDWMALNSSAYQAMLIVDHAQHNKLIKKRDVEFVKQAVQAKDPIRDDVSQDLLSILKDVHVPHDLIVGDFSTTHGLHPLAPRRVAQSLPDAKYVMLLRDPVKRAFSHYSMMMDIQQMSFAEIVDIQLEEAPRLLEHFQSCSPVGCVQKQCLPPFEVFVVPLNKKAKLSRLQKDNVEKGFYFHLYLMYGVYVHQLRRWYEFVPPEKILLLSSEDFYADTSAVMQEWADFMNLPKFDWSVLLI
jgi:hypothetical protein